MLKTLIAEDAKTYHIHYKEQLPESSFELRFAHNGEEALALYKEWQPDIILLDIQMPLLNGYQVLEKIRRECNDSKTPIIMATGMSEKREIVACAKLGIQGYFVKPFDKDLASLIVKHYEANTKRIESTCAA